MAHPKDLRTTGAPPTHVHIGPEHKGTNWFAWIALILGILALLLALSRCDRNTAVTKTVAPQAAAPAAVPVATQRVVLPGGKALELAPATLNYELQNYLASNAPAPRTFTFDKLNFDTASSAIRSDDQPTLDALGQILAAYPKSKVKLVGYADGRGTDPANKQLGEMRAKSVAQALTAKGIAANRIVTTSGGEDSPVASNETAGGQFANRRTELIVTSK